MRLISFALTTPQFLDGSKDVTRRLGWLWLAQHFEAGGGPVLLCGVEKSQGLGKGGKVKRLRIIEVTSARSEPLNAITLAGFMVLGVSWIVHIAINGFVR